MLVTLYLLPLLCCTGAGLGLLLGAMDRFFDACAERDAAKRKAAYHRSTVAQLAVARRSAAVLERIADSAEAASSIWARWDRERATVAQRRVAYLASIVEA